MARTVTLVLVDGTVLPPFEVELPWWQEVREIVAGARLHHGLEVSVLRILETEEGLRNGGKVTYLAEIEGSAANPHLEAHPHRPDYAKPGGPARSIAWARSVLNRPITNVEQQRTWNLSAIWKLETLDGPVWLKQVPRFFAHEAAVLRHLGRPVLLASGEHGRMLLDDIPGEDLYDVDIVVRKAIATDMVRIQLRALQSGLPPEIPPMLALPVEIEAFGLPDTLVHGDLHPGNVRGDAANRTIIDWGDSFVGHPAFDILRLAEGLEPNESAELIDHWDSLWRQAIPGSDPIAAAEALRHAAALRNAAVFAHFLANIEPSEHPYHAEDVPFWIAQAERIAVSAASPARGSAVESVVLRCAHAFHQTGLHRRCLRSRDNDHICHTGYGSAH